jgi:2-oxo-3-hexenedioate decarboxylase
MPTDAETRAAEILRCLDERRQRPPFTDEDSSFDLAAAKRVSQALTALRRGRGEEPAGWKIGFTNRTIWDEYGVDAPIYGPVYATTVTHVTGPAELAIGHLVEPRIEPEIVLRLAKTPRADMDETELAGCLDGLAHGFEIVQSIHPGWRFAAADTVAQGGLHGALAVGPFTPMPGWRLGVEWRRLLESFTIVLERDGVEVERGAAADVLGGPLSALRHFLAELATDGEPPPGPGALVTTGTLTRALPCAPGERWSTKIDGLVVADLDVALT